VASTHGFRFPRPVAQDYTVQFRASRRTSKNDKGANAKLMERLRIALRFEKVGSKFHPLPGMGKRDVFPVTR
jgi:hypothetical protein